jgi:hypothetical protein
MYGKKGKHAGAVCRLMVIFVKEGNGRTCQTLQNIILIKDPGSVVGKMSPVPAAVP